MKSIFLVTLIVYVIFSQLKIHIAEAEYVAEDTLEARLNPEDLVVEEKEPGAKTRLFRLKRASSPCQVPGQLENSEIHCTVFNSHIVCIQKCMFGYTFNSGTKREMKCDLETDKWSPYRNFEDCKPFVDCTINLGPGGKMSCTSNYLDQGPECKVSCRHYEDQKAVKEKVYKCDIRGNWKPKLPFCAKAGTGLILVSPPGKD